MLLSCYQVLLLLLGCHLLTDRIYCRPFQQKKTKTMYECYISFPNFFCCVFITSNSHMNDVKGLFGTEILSEKL